MASSTAQIIQQLLIDNSFGVASTDATKDNWPIYSIIEPNEPDRVITIYDTTGLVDGRLQINGKVVEHLGIQIRIRSNDNDVGNDKIQAIKVFMDETLLDNTVTVLDSSGTNSENHIVHSASRTSTVLSLGRDIENSNRFLFTINYVISFD